jgi:SNF2 family DNA or RNA helicase
MPGAHEQGRFLTEIEWQPCYSHEDGDLVELFFEPTLSRSILYQRVTGYFSANVLILAARGLDALLANGGRMELIVGCTLGPEEIRQIEAGYKLRELLGKLMSSQLDSLIEDLDAREKLGRLAWMIANNRMDIKVAVPRSALGNFEPGLGLYHAKAGVLTDRAGNRLSFTGSINETEFGWKHNWESFTVSCSWRGEWDAKRVEKTALEFAALWRNEAKSAEVIEFPEALKKKMLEYLPAYDASPPLYEAVQPDVLAEKPPEKLVRSNEETFTPEERRKLVWGFIKNASRRPDGALASVHTSMIEPWPHQLRVFKRMLDAWPFRLLIADEVGLGKTIEAGMFIRHAYISELARRILIMAPKAVMHQWQSELYEKFNLLTPIYTGSSFVWPKHHFPMRALEEKVERDVWTRQPLVLVSSQLMRRQDRQEELIEAENWDMIVLDEAHHARRQGAGTAQEKGPNRLLRLMLKIKEKSECLLLLTATPMQVHPVEIWDLLQLLGLPPEWIDNVFVEYFEAVGKNPDEKEFFRLARLFQAVERTYGPLPDSDAFRVTSKHGLSPLDAKKVLKALREEYSRIPLKRLNVRQRKAGLAILKSASPVQRLMSRHTRSLLREYHKKGLLDSPIATRLVRDVSIELTPSERALYDAVEDYISTTYQAADPDKKNAVGFVMTIYRRRVASCFHALRRTLEKRLSGIGGARGLDVNDARLEEDVPQDESADEILSNDEAAQMAEDALNVEERASIQGLLKSISKLGTDSKALRLIEELKNAFSDGYDKAIIFTQYTDTMDFLKDFLADRLDAPIGCFCGDGGQRRDISGGWIPCTKEQIKNLLKEGKIRILICTDAAGEGLNLQFCGLLFNYDLPWNPMKVEQRIGRIDRIGQKYDNIRIVNFAYADTVEADVYFALSQRIGLFTGVVGKLQPILAQLPKQFEAATLVPQEHRERARHDIRSNVEQFVNEAEAKSFDIDDVSDMDLDLPRFPAPPMEPSDMDRVLRDERLLPPGVECRELERSTYALRIPGQMEFARITTAPSIFDEHFESHQLLQPGAPLFQVMANLCQAEVSEEKLQEIGNLKELL